MEEKHRHSILDIAILQDHIATVLFINNKNRLYDYYIKGQTENDLADPFLVMSVPF